MDRLKVLGDQMEEINQEQDKCANESCIMTRKNNELVKCAKTILEETAKLVQEVGVEDIEFDQCMFGLTDVDPSGERPCKKPTRIPTHRQGA